MKRIDGSLTNKYVKDYYPLHRRRDEMHLEVYHDGDMCKEEIRGTLAILECLIFASFSLKSVF